MDSNGSKSEVLKYILAILVVVTILAGIIYFISDKFLAKADQYAAEYGKAMEKKEVMGGVKDLLGGLGSMGRK